MKGQPHPNGMVAVEVVVAAQEFQTLRMTVAQPCGVVDVAVHTADELPISVLVLEALGRGRDVQRR